MLALRPPLKKWLLLAVLMAAVTLGVTQPARAVSRRVLTNSPIDETHMVTLTGNVRPEANATNDRGPVGDAFQLDNLQLVLARPAAAQAALDAYIQSAETQGSANYHHWLTAAQIGAEYGPAPEDLAVVEGWLEAHGFQVNGVSASGLTIDFSGTAGQVAATFKTELHILNVKGQRHFANMENPQIPAALAPLVVGISSLNDFRPHPLSKPARRQSPLAAPPSTPRPNYTYDQYNQLLVPADLQTIYNFNPVLAKGITGRNQSIVVVEDTDLYSNADYATFRTTFGMSKTALTVEHPGRGCRDPGILVGNDFEATLDAEWSAAAAPDAQIILASCADTATNFGGFIALQNMLDSNAPPAIVSISYGECEAALGASGNRYIANLYQQAAAEGTSVYVAAGDEGAASCDADEYVAQYGIAVSGYASTPYNVAVGGTDFADSYYGTNLNYWNATNAANGESAKGYIPEMPWDDSCANGPLAASWGYTTETGPSGFCNSELGADFYLAGYDVVAGSGGPSGCAYGATSPGSNTAAVSGSCEGYAKPYWQYQVAGNPNDGVRDIPDVSMFAANGLWGHYLVVCYSDPGYYGEPCSGPVYTWAGGGGTSFAAPVMAGVQSLINQKAGEPQGNPDSVYYQLAATAYGRFGNPACDSSKGGSQCVFHDVTFGDNDVACSGRFNCYGAIGDGTSTTPPPSTGVLSLSPRADAPSYTAAPGWDFATGIGSVNVNNLVNAWPYQQY